MRRASLAIVFAMVICSTTAYSNDPPARAKPADLEALLKQLTEKLEKLEKRLSTLEAENEKLREALANPRVHVIQAPQQQKKDRPKFHLLNHTELGIPFDVERAMMGDAFRQEFQLRQLEPQPNYEFKVDPSVAPQPEFIPNPQP